MQSQLSICLDILHFISAAISLAVTGTRKAHDKLTLCLSVFYLVYSVIPFAFRIGDGPLGFYIRSVKVISTILLLVYTVKPIFVMMRTWSAHAVSRAEVAALVEKRRPILDATRHLILHLHLFVGRDFSESLDEDITSLITALSDFLGQVYALGDIDLLVGEWRAPRTSLRTIVDNLRGEANIQTRLRFSSYKPVLCLHAVTQLQIGKCASRIASTRRSRLFNYTKLRTACEDTGVDLYRLTLHLRHSLRCCAADVGDPLGEQATTDGVQLALLLAQLKSFERALTAMVPRANGEF